MTKALKKIFKLFSFLAITLNISSESIKLNDADILTNPLPLPSNAEIYNTSDLDNFIDSSIDSQKQPIIIFGANWCPDCRVFSGTIEINSVKKFTDKNFNIMYIDVGRYDKNMNLIEYFDIPPADGIPRVLVFNLNREIINNSTTTEWRTARDRTSQEIFNFFQIMAKN